MNKNIIVLVLLALAITGTLLVTQKNKQAARQRQAQLKAAEEANRLAAEAQQAINEAKKLEDIARQEAEALKNQIAGYVFEAKSSLDNAQYQQAIDTAKNILSYDAENAEARVILETAMTELKEIALQQTNALSKKEVQKITEDSALTPNIPKQ